VSFFRLAEASGGLSVRLGFLSVLTEHLLMVNTLRVPRLVIVSRVDQPSLGILAHHLAVVG
jgi:hypothetical protein